jgi:hypothetical protein
VPSQLLFREANEQILLRRDPECPASHTVIEAICECERRSCLKALRLSRAEYETIRQFPTRFLLAPGHSSLSDERIVEQRPGYVVVEKTGVPAQLAIRLDPRRRRWEELSVA